MKKLGKSIGKAFVFCAVMMLLCSFAYPLALTGVSQVAMKEKANGNLIDQNGNPTVDPEEAVGSALVGQDFTEDYFFKGRVSSVNYNTYTEEQKENGEYAGVSSGSYNYGNSNPELKERIEKDLDEFLATHPGVKKEDVPSDLLTASGSGLDPHISPEAAEVQVKAVAEHSGLSEETVREIVKENTEEKVLGIYGEARVNVLKCNLGIAEKMGLI
ncbi:K(+)-transporting ATPase subunit C [Mediterraneibacter glycyrrhizinilyticus]|uniref:potassium-transporting ATPase subunit KdpC n=1 Tax=Mediterraneibacter glycyrrhizinilyticus TaxID=342942 RepID=UPI000E417D8E|nr:potassium-transporting ATPase subunit KdpC [Lachnospiraceae bacterium AM23-2LB]RJW02531.1 potassium-transporting ATPase subunit KdpC [Lachnospiraceae bacterium AM40-2BH]